MRHFRTDLFIVGAMVLALMPVRAVFGQTPGAPAQADLMPPPTWPFNDIACAPTLTTQPAGGLHVVGSQDAVIKNMLGPGDILVVSGGSNEGLQPGQQFFVRRNVLTFGKKGPTPLQPVTVHTAGWVQILGVDTAVATATVVHACDGILLDDYLEPFTPPMIAARVVPGNTPQYANMGHILAGDEAFENVAYTSHTINIDRGSDSGVVLGQRYLVFRDKRGMLNESPEYSKAYRGSAHQLPLVEVGEVVVVAVRPDYSTVEVVMAKDAISGGDFIAEIK
jgi:hypothetical protein